MSVSASDYYYCYRDCDCNLIALSCNYIWIQLQEKLSTNRIIPMNFARSIHLKWIRQLRIKIMFLIIFASFPELIQFESGNLDENSMITRMDWMILVLSSDLNWTQQIEYEPHDLDYILKLKSNDLHLQIESIDDFGLKVTDLHFHSIICTRLKILMRENLHFGPLSQSGHCYTQYMIQIL